MFIVIHMMDIGLICFCPESIWKAGQRLAWVNQGGDLELSSYELQSMTQIRAW